MKFHVTEIKALGSGMGRRLSLRLEKSNDPGSGQAESNGMGDPPPAVFTIHAVVPFSPEFGPTRIGQEFELKEVLPVRPSVVCGDPNCQRYSDSGHPHLISIGCGIAAKTRK